VDAPIPHSEREWFPHAYCDQRSGRSGPAVTGTVIGRREVPDGVVNSARQPVSTYDGQRGCRSADVPKRPRGVSRPERGRAVCRIHTNEARSSFSGSVTSAAMATMSDPLFGV